MKALLELVATIAVAVVAAFLLQAFVIKPYRIPSGSMVPTLAIGQRVLVQRIDTRPSLGEIVVFHPPAGANPMPAVCGAPAEGTGDGTPCDRPTARESSQTFIKRVVGLPGDRISIRDGHVYRNGRQERAAYAEPCDGAVGCTFTQTITVPRGDYYMMGDNRPLSDDSRFWGPVPQRWIIGTAVATYWPLNRIGHPLRISPSRSRTTREDRHRPASAGEVLLPRQPPIAVAPVMSRRSVMLARLQVSRRRSWDEVGSRGIRRRCCDVVRRTRGARGHVVADR